MKNKTFWTVVLCLVIVLCFVYTGIQSKEYFGAKSELSATALSAISNSNNSILPLPTNVTPITYTTFSSKLALGSKGDTVKLLQKMLKNQGEYPTTASIDGSYGSMTFTAVQKFQKDNGLLVTGNVDAATINLLNTMNPDMKVTRYYDKNLNRNVKQAIVSVTKNGVKYYHDCDAWCFGDGCETKFGCFPGDYVGAWRCSSCGCFDSNQKNCSRCDCSAVSFEEIIDNKIDK